MNKREIKKLKRELFLARVYTTVGTTSNRFNNGFAWGIEKALEIGGVSDNERWRVSEDAQQWAKTSCPSPKKCVAGCRACADAADEIIGR
jgi:hypothetical protein